MNTKEALHAMIDGKKVKREHWAEGVYTYTKGAMFFNQNGGIINSFRDSNDWEIYKDPKQKETVTIEKWLCLDTVTQSYCICEESCVDAYINDDRQYLKKVKLLETYEVTL